MVGITIQNQVNQNNKPIGNRFIRKDQLSGDVIWSVFEKFSQSNSRFNALDTMVVTVHSVRMPVGFGVNVLKSRGSPLSVMAQFKRSIVEVKTEENCLAHALVIEIAKVDKDPNYDAFRKGRKIRQVVQTLFETTGIDLSNGAGIPELVLFEENFPEHEIIVYHRLNCGNIIFEGQVDSTKRFNILYDNVERHYHVITNLTCVMARKFMCKGCNMPCTSDVTHACDQTCRDGKACPPCAFSVVIIPCAECNRHFRNDTFFANHKQCTSKKNQYVNERGVV
jgi:hypothetical protein